MNYISNALGAVKEKLPDGLLDKLSDYKATIKNRVMPFIAAGVIATTPLMPQKADALFFTDVPIGDNFFMSGDITDTCGTFNVEYTGPNNSGFFGNSVGIDGLHFGGGVTLPGGWNYSTTPNPDGSNDYALNSVSPSLNIKPDSPLNFEIQWAPENGQSVPEGLGLAPLTNELYTEIGFAGGFEHDGNIPATYAHANGTTPVPEPATIILLGSGLLGLAGVVNKRRKELKD